MSTLNEFLAQKRQALLERRAAVQQQEPRPHVLAASAQAEGRSD